MKLTEKISSGIVGFKYGVLIIFAILLISSFFLIPKVHINYDILTYFPDSSMVKQGIEKSTEEFGQINDLTILVKNVSANQGQEIALELTKLENIHNVLYSADQESSYKDGNAIIRVLIDETDSKGDSVDLQLVVENIKSTIDNYAYALDGGVVNSILLKNVLSNEMPIIMLVAISIVLLILILMSKSWIEPFLFLIVTGVAILINLGTNIVFTQISFMTSAICALLQLALSMDYSIVLLSRYDQEKKLINDNKVAMARAMAHCISPVSASALTTIAGLIALCFMEITIGIDLGLVLIKGIFWSFVTVYTVLPALLLIFSSLHDKTRHKAININANKLASFSVNHKKVISAVALCAIIIGAFAQSLMVYDFSVEAVKHDSPAYAQKAEIIETIGEQNIMLILVPKDDYEKQKVAVQYLDNLYYNGHKAYSSVASITTTALFIEYSASEIKENYKFSDELINKIYDYAQKDIDIDKIYVIEILKAISENKLLIDEFNAVQTKLNDAYTLAYSQYFNQDLQDKFLLTESQAESVLGYAASTWLLGYQALDIIHAHYKDLNLSVATKIYINYIYEQLFKTLNYNYLIQDYGLSDDYANQLLDRMGKTQSENFAVYELCSATYSNFISQIGLEVQTQIDSQYILANQGAKTFDGKEISRIICNIDYSAQSEEALEIIAQTERDLNILYAGSDIYYVGVTPSVLEMKAMFSRDIIKINIFSILAVLLIILLIYRSLSMPVLLIAVIQGAIMINIASNALVGNSVHFIGYLIAVCIQMGATIDYGILTTDNYIKLRKQHNKTQSIQQALTMSMPTILTSGSILIVASLSIAFISSCPAIASVGLVVGIGAVFSCLLIIFALPALLPLFDKIIGKTTKNANFLNEEEQSNN